MANRERIKAQVREYYYANKEEIKANSRSKYAESPEYKAKILARNETWAEDNLKKGAKI